MGNKIGSLDADIDNEVRSKRYRYRKNTSTHTNSASSSETQKSNVNDITSGISSLDISSSSLSSKEGTIGVKSANVSEQQISSVSPTNSDNVRPIRLPSTLCPFSRDIHTLPLILCFLPVWDVLSLLCVSKTFKSACIHPIAWRNSYISINVERLCNIKHDGPFKRVQHFTLVSSKGLEEWESSFVHLSKFKYINSLRIEGGQLSYEFFELLSDILPHLVSLDLKLCVWDFAAQQRITSQAQGMRVPNAWVNNPHANANVNAIPGTNNSSNNNNADSSDDEVVYEPKDSWCHRMVRLSRLILPELESRSSRGFNPIVLKYLPSLTSLKLSIMNSAQSKLSDWMPSLKELNHALDTLSLRRYTNPLEENLELLYPLNQLKYLNIYANPSPITVKDIESLNIICSKYNNNLKNICIEMRNSASRYACKEVWWHTLKGINKYIYSFSLALPALDSADRLSIPWNIAFPILASCKNLTSLNLEGGMGWSNPSILISLKHFNALKRLGLRDSAICDQSMDIVCNTLADQLLELDLSQSAFSFYGLTQLSKLTNLTSLDLSQCCDSVYSDAGLKLITSNKFFNKLNKLTLFPPHYNPSKAGKHAWYSLVNLPSLTSISITGADIIDDQIAYYWANKLELLKQSKDNNNVTLGWEEIRLAGTKVSALGAARLMRLSTVRILDYLPPPNHKASINNNNNNNNSTNNGQQNNENPALQNWLSWYPILSQRVGTTNMSDKNVSMEEELNEEGVPLSYLPPLVSVENSSWLKPWTWRHQSISPPVWPPPNEHHGIWPMRVLMRK